MTVLIEGNLRFDFSKALNVRKFDDNSHKLSHCMSAVDFIVETTNELLFIEVKDPLDPSAPVIKTAEFFAELESGELDSKFVHKYRDSFLYEWASDNIPTNKPIYYYLLIALDPFPKPLLLTRTKIIQGKLPVRGPKNIWKKPIVYDCQIFNITEWNKYIPQFPVRRLPRNRFFPA